MSIINYVQKLIGGSGEGCALLLLILGAENWFKKPMNIYNLKE